MLTVEGPLPASVRREELQDPNPPQSSTSATHGTSASPAPAVLPEILPSTDDPAPPNAPAASQADSSVLANSGPPPGWDPDFYAPKSPSPDRGSYYGSDFDEFEGSDVGDQYVPDGYGGTPADAAAAAWRSQSLMCVHCYALGHAQVRVGLEEAWVRAHMRNK
jgi:hypothetical protein